MQNRKRLEFATLILLADMRRRYSAMHPEATENPVKNLMDYPPEERGALMASLEKAIDSTAPEKDAVFNTWLASQTADA